MSTTTTTGTLAAGESKTFTLAPGAAVSLTLSPNIRVTITETPESVSGSGVGGNTSRVHEPQLPGTFAYGPYAMGGVVVVAVASNSGSSVAWTRKDTVVTTSSDGTSLVSGDGRSILNLAPPPDPLVSTGSLGTLATNWSGAVFGLGATNEFSRLAPDSTATSSINLVGNAADGVFAEKISLSLNTTGFTGIGLWVQGPVRAGDAAPNMTLLRLYLGVGGYTKAINGFITVPADGEWHFVHINKYQFTAAGGFVYGDVVDRVRLRVGDAADATGSGFTRLAAGESCYVGPLYINPKTRPKFMIRIDDGLSDVVTQNPAVDTALPDGTPAPAGGWSHQLLLERYGFKASLFILARRVGTSNSNKTFLTWDQLDALRKKGWAVCLQTFFDPVDALNSGMRLLGPTGFLDRAVASVDISLNTITASLAHNISPGAVYWGYPVLFTGTNLPAPLVTGTVYWAKYVSTTALTLHPTENDAIAGTATIDLTTTGTAANFFFRYAAATNDHLGAQYDFESGRKLLIKHGYESESKHCALNQGAFNFDIAKAAINAGITHLYCALYTTVSKTHLPNASPVSISSGTFPLVPLVPQLKIMGGIQTDAAGMTQGDVDTFVSDAVTNGGWSQNFHHALNNPNTLILARLLAGLRAQVDAGAIDVVVATDLV